MRVVLVTSLLIAYTWARMKTERLAAVKRAQQPDDPAQSLENLANDFYAQVEENAPVTTPNPRTTPGRGQPGRPGLEVGTNANGNVDGSPGLNGNSNGLLGPQRFPTRRPPPTRPSRPILRFVPRRCNSRSEFREIDGSCNNLRLGRTRWGASKIPLLRLVRGNTYEDNFNAPRQSHHHSLGRVPSARKVSTAVHVTRSNLSSEHSHLMMGYAQFLDHDLTLSPEDEDEFEIIEECCEHGDGPFFGRLRECFPIQIPSDDPVFNRTCIPFLRSTPTRPPRGERFQRFQLNDLTAYVDGSNVYGSTKRTADTLRSFVDGKMKVSRGKNNEERLPLDPANPPRCSTQNEECEFIAGDVRSSEQAGLSGIHTLLLREHNRIATEIKRINPQFARDNSRDRDEKIFQITRKIIGGMLQRISYREFLPEILGPAIMRRFNLGLSDTGFVDAYSTNVDASIVTEFSTAAYRFGHSLVRQSFGATPGPQIDLNDMFDAVKTVDRFGATALLKGMTTDAMESCERFITRGLRDKLFGDQLDLPALNIHRGRDHGIASWMDVRKQLRLRTFTSYDRMIGVTHDLQTINSLKEVYPDPRDIELFPGGMSELAIKDGVVGETFAHIIGVQFDRIRRGDRFWHERDNRIVKFTTEQLQEIRKASFAGLYCENVPNAKVREYLLLRESSSNPQVDCSNIPKLDLTKWGPST